MTSVSLSLLHNNEGLTIDVVYRLLYTIGSSLMLALSAFVIVHGNLNIFKFNNARNVLVNSVKVDVWHRITLIWLGMTIAIKLNETLNRFARNNWNWNSKSTLPAQEQIVVVTGASGGLGKAICNRLADKGYKVVALDIVPSSQPWSEPSRCHDLPLFRDLTKVLCDKDKGITFYEVNLTDRQAVLKIADTICKQIGSPHILINNAGVVKAKSILDSTQQDIDLTFDVNTKAHFWTVQAFLPDMIRRNEGHVITMASSTAYIQAPNGVAYCASKSAALSFHEGLQLELYHVYKSTNVKTSIICPAHVETDLFKGFKSNDWIPQWLTPSLKIQTIVELIEKIISSHQSQHVIEPFYAKLKPLFRIVPHWIQAIGYE
ncbi:hypothetical protein OIO90_002908 [Microbotryomycetes sp. JL221]|nr:hypothetical protein OIO90_002908 [Microbotryomycetes sp. JL221]